MNILGMLDLLGKYTAPKMVSGPVKNKFFFGDFITRKMIFQKTQQNGFFVWIWFGQKPEAIFCFLLLFVWVEFCVWGITKIYLSNEDKNVKYSKISFLAFLFIFRHYLISFFFLYII